MRQKNSAWCFYVGQFAQFTYRARSGWFCVFLDPTTLPPAKSHCQMHVARVYFQQPIATQIALQALYPERLSSWREMWPYQASFRRLTVAMSGSCWRRSWSLVVWRPHSSCALCRRWTGVFCSTCARMSGFFSPDRLWGSNLSIRITGWRPLGTWTVSTLLESWCISNHTSVNVKHAHHKCQDNNSKLFYSNWN